MPRALTPRAGRGALLAFALLVCGCLLAPLGASASQTVTLKASFSPDKLGASTTIGFGFHIASTTGGLPSPLTHVDLRMPPNMNYLTSSLGVAECQPERLVEKGITGCPANSRLGYGSAFVEVPFGQNAGQEIPEIQALMGPPKNGNVVVLFYANGLEPVFAQIVFGGELVTGSGLFGEDLSADIPEIKSVTGGPPVSIIDVKSTIGPNHLLYTKHVHGRLVHYRPQGVALPNKCPHGGFPFAAGFAFLDGSKVVAKTKVPCPRSHK